jgi:hypothetical protein
MKNLEEISEQITSFLRMAIDQELEALGEEGRGDVSWVGLLEGAKASEDMIYLADGTGFQISIIAYDKAAVMRQRLRLVKNETFKFTMRDIQVYCSDPERKKKWDSEIARPLYFQLHKIMEGQTEEKDVEVKYDEAIALINKIQAKAEELGVASHSPM